MTDIQFICGKCNVLRGASTIIIKNRLEMVVIMKCSVCKHDTEVSLAEKREVDGIKEELSLA